MLRGLLTISIAAQLLVALAAANTYVVNPDGTGDFPNIQAAVDSVLNGDTILLGNGIFRGPGNRNIECYEKEITIRSKDVNAEGCIVDCQHTRGFTFYRVGPSCILEGVTVTNGMAGGSGGAILCYESAPTIRACVFLKNEATFGGAISSEGGAAPAVIGCTFIQNASYLGGALCC